MSGTDWLDRDWNDLVEVEFRANNWREITKDRREQRFLVFRYERTLLTTIRPKMCLGLGIKYPLVNMNNLVKLFINKKKILLKYYVNNHKTQWHHQ